MTDHLKNARELVIEGMYEDGVLTEEQAKLLLEMNESEEEEFSFIDRKGNRVTPETPGQLKTKIAKFFSSFGSQKSGVIRPSQYASSKGEATIKISITDNGVSFFFSEPVDFFTLSPEQALSLADASIRTFSESEEEDGE